MDAEISVHCQMDTHKEDMFMFPTLFKAPINSSGLSDRRPPHIMESPLVEFQHAQGVQLLSPGSVLVAVADVVVVVARDNAVVVVDLPDDNEK